MVFSRAFPHRKVGFLLFLGQTTFVDQILIQCSELTYATDGSETIVLQIELSVQPITPEGYVAVVQPLSCNRKNVNAIYVSGDFLRTVYTFRFLFTFFTNASVPI